MEVVTVRATVNIMEPLKACSSEFKVGLKNDS